MRACVAATVLLAAATATAVAPASAASAARPCSNGLVALTFDDGPSTSVTRRLIGVLTKHHVPATFFVVGQRVATSPGLARLASRRGFVVANHTYGHELLTGLSSDGIRSTLSRTASALRHAGVRPSKLMRPPYGAIDSRVRTVVAGAGLTPVLWDIDSRDWQSGTSGQISARVLGALRARQSNIVLLHDGVQRSPTTLRAVPSIIRGAKARGYCFADLGPSGRPTPPVPRMRVSNAVVTEADRGMVSLRFAIRLDRPTSRTVSVRVRTVEATAREGNDYRPVDRRVQLSSGTVLRRLTVRVRGDRVDETRERLRLVLGTARGVTITDGFGRGTIRDDDPPPRVRLLDATVTEPTAGSTDTLVRVTLDRPSSRRVVLELATASVDADESDYVPFQVTVTLTPGQRWVDVPVEVLADGIVEPEETFQVRLLSASSATVVRSSATVTIAPPAT
jgi:peptidoglycan/xylan/chitin deacetylase (PgdA/CDA1 family)